MEIVFWNDVVTDHVAYTLSELQNFDGVEVTILAARRELSIRNVQGWTSPKTDTLKIQQISMKKYFRIFKQYLIESPSRTHIFASPFSNLKIMSFLFLGALLSRNIYLISEPYSLFSGGLLSDGDKLKNIFKSVFRPLLYKVYGILLNKSVNGVFAISNLAVDQFGQIGFRQNKIFRFGYFIPPQSIIQEIESSADCCSSDALKIIFVGNIIARKGIDILMMAVSKLRIEGCQIELNLYGPGNPADFGDIDKGIMHNGMIPFGEAQNFIKNYDLLVLSSRFDGWGVVVNEALLSGTPVICTAQVGAHGLITKWGCGEVYDAEDDFHSLTKILRDYARNRNKILEQRRVIKNMVEILHPQVAAKYLLDVIDHIVNSKPVPECLWYD
jgi:glycosyltransferase involved in cell wall biosynthesis